MGGMVYVAHPDQVRVPEKTREEPPTSLPVHVSIQLAPLVIVVLSFQSVKQG